MQTTSNVVLNIYIYDGPCRRLRTPKERLLTGCAFAIIQAGEAGEFEVEAVSDGLSGASVTIITE